MSVGEDDVIRGNLSRAKLISEALGQSVKLILRRGIFHEKVHQLLRLSDEVNLGDVLHRLRQRLGDDFGVMLRMFEAEFGLRYSDEQFVEELIAKYYTHRFIGSDAELFAQAQLSDIGGILAEILPDEMHQLLDSGEATDQAQISNLVALDRRIRELGGTVAVAFTDSEVDWHSNNIGGVHEAHTAMLDRESFTAEGPPIVIPHERIPARYRAELEAIARDRATDLRIVPMAEARSIAESDPDAILLLTEEDIAAHTEFTDATCQSQRMVIQNYDFAYLEGAIALARAIRAGDKEAITGLWSRLSREDMEVDSIIAALLLGRLNLALPPIELPTTIQEYIDLQKEAYELLKSA